MSTTSARRLATSLLALGTAAALSACGAGLDAQTYQQRNAAEHTDGSAGALALRSVAVSSPRLGLAHEVGDDVEVRITVTNAGDAQDRLVSASSSAAREVAVLAGGTERDLVVPAFGSTGDFVTLELRGLTRPLRSGEFVDLTLRFSDNGTTELLVPVAGPGRSDRPVYTGTDGKHEPALQHPTGGHHGEGGEH